MGDDEEEEEEEEKERERKNCEKREEVYGLYILLWMDFRNELDI